MPPTLEQLGVHTLSADDRLALAEALWQSVYEDDAREPLSPALCTELERRVALADADPGRSIPWETVKAEARARWGR